MGNIYIKNLDITDKHIIIPKYKIKLDKDEMLYTLHKNSNILKKVFIKAPIKLNSKYYFEISGFSQFITFFCKNIKDLFYINIKELISKLNLYGHKIDTDPYRYGIVEKYDLIDIYNKNIYNHYFKIKNNNLENNFDENYIIPLKNLYDIYYNNYEYVYNKSNFQKVINYLNLFFYKYVYKKSNFKKVFDYLYSFFYKNVEISDYLLEFKIYIEDGFIIKIYKYIELYHKTSLNLCYLDEIIEKYKKYIRYKNIYTIPKKKLINKLNIYIVDIIYEYLLGISLLNDMKIY